MPLPGLNYNMTKALNLKNVIEIGHHVISSPLHLAMFVESFKDTNKFPSTITEAYIKSLLIALKREIIRQSVGADGCSNIQLFDHSSLHECNRDLASTITNISKLAFDSLAAYDSDIFLYGKRLKTSRNEFSMTELRSYLPSGNSYGLLFSYCHKNEHGTMIRNYYFPYIFFQEFWAAFHVTVAKINVSDFTEHIFQHPHFLYFVCGMYSSNSTMLRQIFEMVLQLDKWPYTLNYYTTCGSESGHSIQSLADIYLKLHGPILHLHHLWSSSSEYVRVLPFLSVIHLNITQIVLSQYSPSLRLYIENITDIFPNLDTVNITVLPSEFKEVQPYLFENIRLLFSFSRRISEFNWIFPMQALLDQEFLNSLEDIFISVNGKVHLLVMTTESTLTCSATYKTTVAKSTPYLISCLRRSLILQTDQHISQLDILKKCCKKTPQRPIYTHGAAGIIAYWPVFKINIDKND